jgi:hypothetical protein
MRNTYAIIVALMVLLATGASSQENSANPFGSLPAKPLVSSLALSSYLTFPARLI